MYVSLSIAYIVVLIFQFKIIEEKKKETERDGCARGGCVYDVYPVNLPRSCSSGGSRVSKKNSSSGKWCM